jgi:hypothetical protein
LVVDLVAGLVVDFVDLERSILECRWGDIVVHRASGMVVAACIVVDAGRVVGDDLYRNHPDKRLDTSHISGLSEDIGLLRIAVYRSHMRVSSKTDSMMTLSMEHRTMYWK